MSTPAQVKRDARITGVWYLLLALAGVFGFLVVRGEVFVEGDAAATAARLAERETLARLGLVAEMTLVVSQVLVALWFYRLFRRVSAFAAGSLAVFGFFNAVVGLVGAVLVSSSLEVALGESTAPGSDVAGTAQLLQELRDATWEVGGLFFGLWLLPMGYLVIKSGFMPRLIGYLLLANGFTYLAGAYLVHGWAGYPSTIAEVALFAVPGEFAVILYLLIRGARVRPRTGAATGAGRPGPGTPVPASG